MRKFLCFYIIQYMDTLLNKYHIIYIELLAEGIQMKKLFDDKFKKIAIYVVVSVVATALFLSVWLNIGKILSFSKTLLSVFSPII